MARLPSTEKGFTPEQRLLILDTWRRSGLPAGDFAPLVGVSRHTLYAWQKAFSREGPGGLVDRPKGAPPGWRLPDLTRRTILSSGLPVVRSLRASGRWDAAGP